MKDEEMLFSLAERLGDLRKEKKLTYEKLSKDIEQKERIYISHTSLNNYEDTDKNKVPSLTYAIALADYYNVPIEYLIGRTNSRKKDISHISMSAKLGLKDKALHRLESMQHDYCQDYKLDLINYFLESPVFMNVLLEQFMNCCNQKSTNNKQNIEASEFGISRTLIEIIDNYYKDLYPHDDNKENNLMKVLDKINKNNKKKK